ncbi:Phosphoinositide phosphatase SAC1, partial [Cucumispora dikerogammari]
MIKYQTIITPNNINIYKVNDNIVNNINSNINFITSFPHYNPNILNSFNYNPLENNKETNNKENNNNFFHYGIIGYQTINNIEFLIFITKQELIGSINKDIYFKIREVKVFIINSPDFIINSNNNKNNNTETSYLKSLLVDFFNSLKDYFYTNSVDLFNINNNNVNRDYVFNSNLFSDTLRYDLLRNNSNNDFVSLFKLIYFGSIECYEFSSGGGGEGEEGFSAESVSISEGSGVSGVSGVNKGLGVSEGSDVTIDSGVTDGLNIDSLPARPPLSADNKLSGGINPINRNNSPSPAIADSVAANNKKTIKFSLISRRSPYSIGTKYFNRGLTLPYNYPANCTETTLYIETDTYIYSNIQLRGSIPLLWKQELSRKYTPTIILTDNSNIDDNMFSKYTKYMIETYNYLHGNSSLNNNNENNNKKLYKSHNTHLNKIYNSKILYANLIKPNIFPEKTIFIPYDNLLRALKLNHINFDINSNNINNNLNINNFRKELISFLPKTTKNLTGYINKDFNLSDYTIYSKVNNKIINKQSYIIRTNCIDSSDRTTHFQIIIIFNLLHKLSYKNYALFLPHNLIKKMFLNSASKLSMHYTGTEMLLYPFSKKRLDSIYDLYKSLKRYFTNRYFDGKKNDFFNLISGKVFLVKYNYN